MSVVEGEDVDQEVDQSAYEGKSHLCRWSCDPRYFVEMRCEAWDEFSDNGVIVFNLSNELVMFRAQLSKLSVELLGMSVCYEELGCTGRELCHGLFEHCYVERDKLRR